MAGSDIRRELSARKTLKSVEVYSSLGLCSLISGQSDIVLPSEDLLMLCEVGLGDRASAGTGNKMR